MRRTDFEEDDYLASALGEADRRRLQLSTLLTTHSQLTALLVAADIRTAELLRLFVSVRARIGANDTSTALASVKDILIDVMGCADFTVYSVDRGANWLVPIAGATADAQVGEPVPLHGSWIGSAVRAGEIVITPRSDWRLPSRIGDVGAIVPLIVLDRLVGAIVIGDVLPHREPLGHCDREILGLVGALAATVIVMADRQERMA